MLTVPSWVYPWVLLVLLSLLLPSISFMGHLGGILVGYLCKSKRTGVIQAGQMMQNSCDVPHLYRCQGPVGVVQPQTFVAAGAGKRSGDAANR